MAPQARSSSTNKHSARSKARALHRTNGRIGHAEIAIDGARIMLSDEHPEIEVFSPPTLGGNPTMFHLRVPDAAAVVARAAAEGATIQRAVQEQPYGERSGTIKDPFGLRWMIATQIEEFRKPRCRSASARLTRSVRSRLRSALLLFGALSPFVPMQQPIQRRQHEQRQQPSTTRCRQ